MAKWINKSQASKQQDDRAMPCTHELQHVPLVDGIRRVELLQDVVAHRMVNNGPNIAYPLAAGTVLESNKRDANPVGDYQWDVPDMGVYRASLPFDVIKSRHPYDPGLYDPAFVKPLYAKPEAVVKPTEQDAPVRSEDAGRRLISAKQALDFLSDVPTQMVGTRPHA